MADDAPSSGRQKAREEVAAVALKVGYVPDEEWQKASPSIRTALEELRSMAADAVTTLAKNVYANSHRFIFELLQNADDNHYGDARERGEKPSVSFSIYSDRIVLDCNENGFTYKNLEAISGIGKSSKKGAQGYIGEKGIGFKSVFMAAWKVTIQSGDYTFFFKQRRTDKGLGMVQPRWYEPETAAPRGITRLTLFLHDDGSPEELKAQRDAMNQQFEKFQESLLLFTKNLKEIAVTFYNVESNIYSQKTFTIQDTPAPTAGLRGACRTLWKSERNDTSAVEKTRRMYYLMTFKAEGLAKNDNRQYSKEEEQSRAYATSNVVLAFPLSDDWEPIEKFQEVYAFLPVREVGFKFLIQGDFVTAASRQDIQTTSARNIGLRTAIADAFMEAVEDFGKMPSLAYTWMRFLPDPKKSFFEGFWSELIKLMGVKIQSHQLLHARDDPSVYLRLRDLRRYSVNHRDANGDPLFKDSGRPLYVSDAYHASDLDRLESYGLQYLTADETLDLVEMDLESGQESRIKSSDRSVDWHERVAGLLLSLTSKRQGQAPLLTRLRSLPVLPLRGGDWIPPDKGTVYFGTCAHTSQVIPDEVGLTLLAIYDPQMHRRGDLFRHLGVASASVDKIWDAIHRQHTLQRVKRLDSLLAQFHYLYRSHHVTKSAVEVASFYLSTSDPTYYKWPRSEDVYYSGNPKYGVETLFEGELARSEGVDLVFLDSSYVESPPATPKGATETWNEWLWRYVGLRRYARLIAAKSGDSEDLSQEVYFVAKHMPDRLAGFLSFNWRGEGSLVAKSPVLVRKMKRLPIMCEGGFTRPLCETYMPFADLRERRFEFMKEEEPFPFLQLDNEVARGFYLRDWDFLVSTLGVGIEPDLDFYDYILEGLAEANEPLQEPQRVMAVYRAMYGVYAQSNDKERAEAKLNDIFHDRKLFCPFGFGSDLDDDDGSTVNWAVGDDCVWDAPGTFQRFIPLRWQLATFFNMAEEQLDDSDEWRLLRQSHAVPILVWKDIIWEFEYVRLNNPTSMTVEIAHDYYSRLWNLLQPLSTDVKKEIWDEFATKCLIFSEDETNRWVNISQCLWSSHTKFRGRVTLSDAYESLEEFFVDFLGVERLNVQVVYKELLDHSSASKPDRDGLDHLKSQLRVLTGFISDLDSHSEIEPGPLLNDQVKIFPITVPGSGDVELVAYTTDFVIPDRLNLVKYFAKKVRMLDFELEEVRELSALFAWLGIESRYLSRSVRESTSIDTTDAHQHPPSQRKIRQRAQGLCRIAYHFGTERLAKAPISRLLSMIQEAQVYETDNINSVIHLTQDGRSETYTSGRSDLHIREDTDKSTVEIWIPRQPKRRALCFGNQLPSELFDWMMSDPNTNIPYPPSNSERGRRLVGGLFNSPTSLIPEFLEREGIVSAGIVMNDEEEEEEEQQEEEVNEQGGAPDTVLGDEEDEETMVGDDSDELGIAVPNSNIVRAQSSLASRSSRSTPAPSLITASPGGPPSSSPRATTPVLSTDSTSTPHPVSRVADVDIESDSNLYRQLLDKVVESARTAELPENPIVPLEEVASLSLALNSVALSDETELTMRFRTKSQIERDKLIGAAGELYMFELLSKLLPDFFRFNWQSTIRDLVIPHPDYTTIATWSGQETSDIVYSDVRGRFTSTLIDRGYLDQSWATDRPRYFLEVKSTTGDCETPLYASHNQYKLMQRCRNNREEVYIICRVYYLGGRRIGLRLYVDPAELEARGELVFSARGWSVTRGRAAA